MALNLFKKVDTRKGLFAVEKITLIYTLLTSILILYLFQEMDHPVRMLFERSLIVGVTFLSRIGPVGPFILARRWRASSNVVRA